MSIPKLLNRVADYYERHPDAWSNGYHLGVAVRDVAQNVNADTGEAMEILREAIGAPGVVGSLTVWTRKHTPEQGIQLLRKTAQQCLTMV